MEFTHWVEFLWLYCEANIICIFKYFKNGCRWVPQGVGRFSGGLQALRGKLTGLVDGFKGNIILWSVFMEI